MSITLNEIMCSIPSADPVYRAPRARVSVEDAWELERKGEPIAEPSVPKGGWNPDLEFNRKWQDDNKRR